jgi:hypothetical protein
MFQRSIAQQKGTARVSVFQRFLGLLVACWEVRNTKSWYLRGRATLRYQLFVARRGRVIADVLYFG